MASPNDVPMEYDSVRGVRNPQEYIPIHTSDRAQFKKCRRRWDWASPSRQNLVPKRSTNGVVFPLWFGTGVHLGLEAHYSPDKFDGATPAEVFIAWYNEQCDLLAREASQWYGDNLTELEDHYDLGLGMLKNYADYAAEHDDFIPVTTEHDFVVPLDMSKYDHRAGKVKEVMYCGRQDLIVYHRQHGYGIMDHKTAADMGDTYFDKLEMDEQCTSYLWAGQREELIDVARQQVIHPTYVLYNVLRKAAPKPPSVLKNSTLSVSRSSEATTYELWQQALDEYNLRDTEWHKREATQMYEEYLRTVGWEQFFQRRLVLRNSHEIESIGEQIKLEVEDMLSLPSIYPNPTGDWYCLKCQFRAPCLATNDGSDVEYILTENYERNTDR